MAPGQCVCTGLTLYTIIIYSVILYTCTWYIIVAANNITHYSGTAHELHPIWAHKRIMGKIAFALSHFHVKFHWDWFLFFLARTCRASFYSYAWLSIFGRIFSLIPANVRFFPHFFQVHNFFFLVVIRLLVFTLSYSWFFFLLLCACVLKFICYSKITMKLFGAIVDHWQHFAEYMIESFYIVEHPIYLYEMQDFRRNEWINRHVLLFFIQAFWCLDIWSLL